MYVCRDVSLKLRQHGANGRSAALMANLGHVREVFERFSRHKHTLQQQPRAEARAPTCDNVNVSAVGKW